MARTQVTNSRAKRQAQNKMGFTQSAKIALIEKKLTIGDLASELGVSRNTISLAINHNLNQPTRQRIAQRLGIQL